MADRSREPHHKIDPITLEVVRGGIVSLCQEMGIAMERSSYSPVFSEGLDYSFALFDGSGEMTPRRRSTRVTWAPCLRRSGGPWSRWASRT